MFLPERTHSNNRRRRKKPGCICFLSNHKRRRRWKSDHSFATAAFFLVILASSAVEAVVLSPSEPIPDQTEVYAVATGSAHLPCNIIPESPTDGASLVLWYKDSDPQPVYSFDARYKVFGQS